MRLRLFLKVNNTHTHTHTEREREREREREPFNGLSPGTTRVGRYQKKHSPTHTHPDHWTSFINFLHLLRSIASSVFSLRADSPLRQPLSRSSLVFLLVLYPLLHTPCISSPSHYLLFAAHAHTLALSSLLGNLSFSLMPHIHLTILISAR